MKKEHYGEYDKTNMQKTRTERNLIQCEHTDYRAHFIVCQAHYYYCYLSFLFPVKEIFDIKRENK